MMNQKRCVSEIEQLLYRHISHGNVRLMGGINQRVGNNARIMSKKHFLPHSGNGQVADAPDDGDCRWRQ